MAQRYPGHFPNAPQHVHHHTAMAPPFMPLSPTTSMYDKQYHDGNHSQRGIPSSSSMYTTVHAQMWRPPIYASFENAFPATEDMDLATSSQRTDRDPPSALNAQDSSRRIAAISPTEWLRVKPIIKRLWLEEKKSLEETKMIMAEKYNFTASMDQYKKQTKKWKWSKNVRDEDAIWMLRKAEERKIMAKDTEFTYHGQVLTSKDITQRLGRKKVEVDTTAPPIEAPTPCDISYTTPRGLLHSPPNAQSTINRITPSVWTPPAEPIGQSQQLKITWRGLNYMDYESQYRIGCEDAQFGRAHEAEAKFRTALDGFHNLLSNTHDKTIEVARKLAIFYAERDRMREAELIFDWLTEAHVQEFGRTDRRTLNHLLSIVDFYKDCDRPREATALLDRIVSECGEYQDQAARLEHRSVNTAAQPSRSGYESHAQPTIATQYNNPNSLHNTAEPDWLYAQPRHGESAQRGDQSVDEVWNRLLRQCEEFPEQLGSHSLSIHAAMIKQQAQSGNISKTDEAIKQAEKAIHRLLLSDQPKTEDLYDSCVKLTKEFVRAGRYERANETFSHIESTAQDTFGFSHAHTIVLLKNIGIFYQNEDRWNDAAPRFEQALAASLSRYCTCSREVRRLEAALEKERYDTDVPLEDSHIHCDGGSRYRGDDVPEVFVMVDMRRANVL